jgi:hypothetical protein
MRERLVYYKKGNDCHVITFRALRFTILTSELLSYYNRNQNTPIYPTLIRDWLG